MFWPPKQGNPPLLVVRAWAVRRVKAGLGRGDVLVREDGEPKWPKMCPSHYVLFSMLAFPHVDEVVVLPHVGLNGKLLLMPLMPALSPQTPDRDTAILAGMDAWLVGRMGGWLAGGWAGYGLAGWMDGGIIVFLVIIGII